MNQPDPYAARGSDDAGELLSAEPVPAGLAARPRAWLDAEMGAAIIAYQPAVEAGLVGLAAALRTRIEALHREAKTGRREAL